MSHYAELTTDQIDLGAQRASIAIREQLKEIQRGIPSLPTPQNINELAPIVDRLPPIVEDRPLPPRWVGRTEPFRVGIIGAGVAGMFTAMIFDYLNDKYKTNVEYEIMECNNQSRLGGRLYTHYFSDAEHDYYDVGAMRFPDIPTMRQTFELFKLLDMNRQDDSEKAKKGDLIHYYLKGPNNPQLYNDVQTVPPFEEVKGQDSNKKKEKAPTAKTFKVTGLLDWYEDEEPGTLIKDMVQPFVSKLVSSEDNHPLASPKRGWDFLLKFGDSYSVRQWMSKLYDYNTTEWLETYSYGTSWYDEALTELVLEEINFNAPLKDWWCVEGGSQEIAKRMADKIKNQEAFQFNKRVVKMDRHGIDKDKEGADGITISLEVEGENSPREYDAVFNSAPLGAMQRMDLRGLDLNWGTKQAIRSLGYGASCKVGVKFKYRWWVEEEDLAITKGGVGSTDLPIRNCVYPSYNLTAKDASDRGKGEEGKKPGVLLCSYTWSQEAQRIGTLIHPEGGPSTETELKALLIDNLARLHTRQKQEDNPDDYERRLEALKKLIGDAYITHFAYDWYNDLGTTGAFAYFGPGQFGTMYPWIANNNDGNHIIIGEAASAHHAWVVGALESAVRGVYQFLFQHSKNSGNIAAALEAYQKSEILAPYGPLPAEFDRTKDVKEALNEGNKVDESRMAAQGEWARQGVLFETIRLKQNRDQRNRDQRNRDQLDLAKVTADDVAPFLDAQK